MATVTYYKPDMEYWLFCEELLNNPHLLIAGSSGSGKSVLINSIIYTALGTRTPASCEFVLIDPKRVELRPYASLGDWIRSYGTEADQALRQLDDVIGIMLRRYDEMSMNRQKMYSGSDIYVIIDEYADLAITAKKAFQERIVRISQLGRAARIHLIIATQRPTSDTVNAAVKTNMDYRIALHTAEAQHSRNIIGVSGAEDLVVGEGYYYTPFGIRKEAIPYTPDNEIYERIEWWVRNPGQLVPESGEVRKKKPSLLSRLLRTA